MIAIELDNFKFSVQHWPQSGGESSKDCFVDVASTAHIDKDYNRLVATNMVFHLKVDRGGHHV